MNFQPLSNRHPTLALLLMLSFHCQSDCNCRLAEPEMLNVRLADLVCGPNLQAVISLNFCSTCVNEHDGLAAGLVGFAQHNMHASTHGWYTAGCADGAPSGMARVRRCCHLHGMAFYGAA